jgi:hypothetical protein
VVMYYIYIPLYPSFTLISYIYIYILLYVNIQLYPSISQNTHVYIYGELPYCFTLSNSLSFPRAAQQEVPPARQDHHLWVFTDRHDGLYDFLYDCL